MYIDCDFEICKKFEIGLFTLMYTVLYILMWWQPLSNKQNYFIYNNLDSSFIFHKNKKWYFSSHTVNQHKSSEKQLKKEKSLTELPLSIKLKELTVIVAQSCPTLCDPMDCSTPDFPVHHRLPECSNSWHLS